MKFISDLFYMAIWIFAGYVLYKIYQTISSASQAVSGAASQWTPGSLTSSIQDDAKQAYQNLVNAFTAEDSQPDQAQLNTDESQFESSGLDALGSSDAAYYVGAGSAGPLLNQAIVYDTGVMGPQNAPWNQ